MPEPERGEPRRMSEGSGVLEVRYQKVRELEQRQRRRT